VKGITRLRGFCWPQVNFSHGSIRARQVKEDQSVARWQYGGQLSDALLTLMAALAAEQDVGLLALTRLAPSGGDWLLTLRCSPWRREFECPQGVESSSSR
jgi:hypothetical protein